MTLIRKEILVQVKVGDVVKAPNTVYRDDLTLYVCHIEGDLRLKLKERQRTLVVG
jgi:hypothetical protein